MNSSFNTSLLSFFSKSLRVGKDVKSALKRFQALSIIYSNLSIMICALIWNLLSAMGWPLPCYGINLSVFPLTIVSFIFLKRENHTLAAGCIMAYIHLTIFSLNKINNVPLTALCPLLICPSMAVVLTPCYKTHIINGALCLIQHLNIMVGISETFRVTFTDEQSKQIIQLQIGVMLDLVIIGSLAYVQKTFETNIWMIAQTNFERAEKINEEVMQAIQAKDTFLSSLSHEIRNPLNAMKGSIDYLIKVIQDQTHIRVLENAHLSSEVLLQLLNNVLDAAKLKSEKMELAYTESNILNIIKKIGAIYSERIVEKEITGQILLDKCVPKTIWVDCSRLLQIIMNLLSNALKFTPVGGRISVLLTWCPNSETTEALSSRIADPIFNSFFDIRSFKKLPSPHSMPTLDTLNNLDTSLAQDETSMEFSPTEQNRAFYRIPEKSFEVKTLDQIIHRNIEISQRFAIWNMKDIRMIDSQNLREIGEESTRQSKGSLKIQVSDNGTGIPEEYLPHLFSMFAQGHRNVASIYGGSGLGLWICKQLCRKMGGDITLYTQPNKGSTFVFYLPIDNRNLEHATSESQSNRNRASKEVRALVVDDYSYNREIHKLLLEREGVQVAVACNGVEAVEKYCNCMQGEDNFDFIFLDIQMPEMDGFTVAQKIRDCEKEKKWKRVDIYFVSGEYYNEQEVMSELKTKGYIKETSGIRCLRKPIDLEAIKNIVNKFHLEREEAAPLNHFEPSEPSDQHVD